ncbi:helix-hairpin-helix domain-containing protein [Dyadobacter sandarakinus]|uniref:Helix-hairpin-helix domain-containing protein n=2 Tax=Dyadobacter sandarakinus TaxID=2747268 RepID=A0ABX7IDI7_9BACT|nr:helix-hairpin-helix domain-containing protein [Dyadobacter sandarakinus]
MWKNTLHVLQDFFGLSRKEARGAMVLMILCFLILWSPFVFRRWVLPAFPVQPSAAEFRMLDSIARALATRSTVPGSKSGAYVAGDLAPPRKLFAFDPNKASPEQLTALGIPPFLVKRMDRFRQKGGHFYRKEQLLKIYDFPPDLYKRLESYITLSPVQKTDAPASPFHKTSETGRRATWQERKVPAAFDINTADTTRLTRLKGIGSKLSARIVKFRDALGGFHSVAQFREIYGLDSAVVQELVRFGKIETPVKLLNINTATVEQLAAHPYLRNRRLAGIIVSYRTQHGPFQHAADLAKVKVLDQETLRKMEPYLTF